MRVQADHWAVILDFCEANPEIITNKLKGPNGRDNLKQKWAELTVFLNSLGLGKKNTEEWKKTIIDWKSKTKGKAQSICNYVSGTGGGPQGMTLTSFEERLLAIMGKTAVQGNKEVKEIGIKRNHEPEVSEPRYITISKDKCEPYQQCSKVLIIDNQIVTQPVNNQKDIKPCTISSRTPISMENISKYEKNTVSRSYATSSVAPLNEDQFCSQPISTQQEQVCKPPLLNTINKHVPNSFTLSVTNNAQVKETVSSPHTLGSPVAELSGHIKKQTPRLNQRRRENNPQLSQQLQTMNDNTLEVLNNINSNISNISMHLADLVEVIKDFKK